MTSHPEDCPPLSAAVEEVTELALAGAGTMTSHVYATETSRLTDTDREAIARSREVGAVLRRGDSNQDRLAGWLLAELADLAERLADD